MNASESARVGTTAGVPGRGSVEEKAVEGFTFVMLPGNDLHHSNGYEFRKPHDNRVLKRPAR